MFAYAARLEDDFSVPSPELGGLENIEPDPVTGYPCLSDNGIRQVIHDLIVLAGQRRPAPGRRLRIIDCWGSTPII